VVVARRYRPQDFGDLVGQQQVSRALANAINTNRVGHAYLFTGARGVGKTSTARILAKCLNCVDGPTPHPCGKCEHCIGIAQGEDVDVLEIDGASNRGIDEIRQLRSNVNIRPSSSRYKVYIIDEVHMLTTPAFNALLKTLEEPPDHVKFIFCTTDPEKMPITVISRCQRFDFAGIQTESIIERLRHIVASEQADVDDAALRLLARRAGGSMRDSQSLLEQLLAFGGERITAEDVHRLLGTASSGRVWHLVRRLTSKDAAQALGEFDAAIGEGADPGQLIEQLAGCFRDLMAHHVGCSEEVLLHVGGDEVGELQHAAEKCSLPNVLAALQIFDEALLRMRQSTQARTVAETAIVRVCCLEQLENLASVIGQLRAGELPAPSSGADSAPRANTPPARPAAQKKTAELTRDSLRSDQPHRAPAAPQANRTPPPSSATPVSSRPGSEKAVDAVGGGIPLTESNLDRIWQQALEKLDGMTHSHASRCSRLAISAPNRLVIQIPATYTSSKAYCERPQQRQELEQALQAVVGSPVRIDFQVAADRGEQPRRMRPKLSQVQLKKQVSTHPLVQTVVEMFDGTVVAVEPGKVDPGKKQPGDNESGER